MTTRDLPRECGVLLADLLPSADEIVRVARLDEALAAERAAHAFTRARLEAAERAFVGLYDAFERYIEQHGLEHDDEDCPEDDTCECEYVGAINAAYASALRVRESLPAASPARAGDAERLESLVVALGQIARIGHAAVGLVEAREALDKCVAIARKALIR